MATTLTLRTLQSDPLTNQEVDNNFSSLKNNKLELDGSLPMTGRLELAASTANFASINFASGVNTATANLDAGDLYYNSNQLKMYDGTDVLTFLSANSSGVVSNNITQINSSSSFTVDAATDIILDSDSGNVYIKDGGTTIAGLVNSSNNFLIDATANLILDADSGSIILKDDGTEFGRIVNTSTTLEIESGKITFDSANDIDIDADSGNIYLKDNGTTYGVLNNNSGNLVIKSNTTNAVIFNNNNSQFQGEVKAGYFSTAANLVGSVAYTENISAASTSMFGSWGDEPNDGNIEYRGGISHNIGIDCSGPGTAEFKSIGDGTNNGGAMMLMGIGGRVEFYTVASTGGADKTVTAANMWSNQKRMVIDDAGRTTVYGAVHVSGTGLAVGTALTPSAVNGRIDAENDVVAFSTSDARLKENIENIPNALDKLMQLNGVTYTWKSEFQHLHGFTGQDTGLIAQDVEKVLPEVVQHRDNGYMAVKYEKIIGLLVEAIKELNIKVDKCTCNK